MKKIMIAATKSGSGKTTITCALLCALRNAGLKVRSFKCGPDYIDPMFHKKVLGIESKNLDLFFTDEAMTKRLFMLDNDSDISVIEGVMGLYDGIGGISVEASSYHLAKTLKCPIILVIDAHGMGRSILAEIKGFLSLDDAGLIKGVILNRTSKSFYETVKPLIEDETGVECLGFVPKLKQMVLNSRHLGLVLPDEVKDLNDKILEASKEVTENVGTERLIEISAEETEDKTVNIIYNSDTIRDKVRVAVAMDEAFCFYYEDNLRLLKEAGCEIIPFSPIHDRRIPDDIRGMILGGGYPENYAAKLSQNISMRSSVKAAIEDKMPTIAECGGFMYLHDILTVESGENYPMAGVIKGHCHYTGHLVRFGYITLSENDSYSLSDENSVKENNSEKNKKIIKKIKNIKGHEFHYFDSDSNGDDWIAAKVNGKNWMCMSDKNGQLWGFPHLYYPSNPAFAKAFYDECINYDKIRNIN